MKNIRRLLFIPPTQRLRIHADPLERGQALVNLDLQAAMRQHVRNPAIEYHLHPRESRIAQRRSAMSFDETDFPLYFETLFVGNLITQTWSIREPSDHRGRYLLNWK